MLEEKLVSLKKDLIEYAAIVESMVDKSIKGLAQKDKNILLEVTKKDEPRVNNYEIEIDEKCTNLIAQYKPNAKYLRTLLMILKMGGDLERMGDHAVNIVESSMFLIERTNIKPYIDVPKMGEIVMKMLNDSILSFINEDPVLAKEVCSSDDVVDDLKDKIVLELSGIMTKDSTTVDRALHLLRITGNLERIADLSTNISEDVLYMVEGRVIKHHKEDEENQNG